MKKVISRCGLSVALIILSGQHSYSQNFQKTFYEAGADMNHYSIETAPNDDYVIAGTLFREDNQDIHVMRLDPLGNVLWSVSLDETADDRALDVVVDSHGDIVVVGYVSPTVNTDVDLYAIKLDPSGGFIADLQVEGFATAAGTNIIHSEASDSYIVGGFMGDTLAFPMEGTVARVLELDLALNVINHQEISTDFLKHTSINDIIEVPSGYFITGSVANSVSLTLGQQGVLAVFLDHSLNIVSNLSFESTNSEQCGVSAVYLTDLDEVWVMSNSSASHNAQINQITDIGGTPAISPGYYFWQNPNNAAGFKLTRSPYNANSLVAAGLFRENTDNTGLPNSTIPWIIEFDRATGTIIDGFTWPVPSPNFHMHGGGLFSTFSGEHPYFFNQELMVERPDGNGFTIVSPIREGSNYAIDVVTSLALNQQDMPCFEAIEYEPITLGHSDNTVSLYPEAVVASAPEYSLSSFSISSNVHCERINDNSSINDNFEPLIPHLIQLGGATVDVSPNPILNRAFIEISGENLANHQYSVLNSLGEVLFTSPVLDGNHYTKHLDVGDYPAGIYFLMFSNNKNGEMKSCKLIKH
jgi:hypothetical protein